MTRVVAVRRVEKVTGCQCQNDKILGRGGVRLETGQGEKTLGAGYVEGDLGAEGFGGGPLFFFAETLEERELEWGGFG
jgi:hypothetical protein